MNYSKEAYILVEREQRKQFTWKIIAWECRYGKVLMPTARDFTTPRIQQLVDSMMADERKKRGVV